MIKDIPSKYLAKVDADLDLPPDYFEKLLNFMEQTPSVGICSGHPFTYEKAENSLKDMVISSRQAQHGFIVEVISRKQGTCQICRVGYG